MVEARIPTVVLTGAAEANYVRDAARILKRARLNSQYPPSRPLAAHIECMAPEHHRGLYAGLRVDLRSGLPAYPEWVRVKTDVEVAPGALDDIRPRHELEQRARARPDSIHGKQLLKRGYYEVLVQRFESEARLAPLSEIDVALRRVEPENNLAHFHVVLDKLDATGVFVRYTIDLAQQSSIWNRPMVTLDHETAGHTDELMARIYKLSSLDAELAFTRLAAVPGLVIDRVVKGCIGPFYFSGMSCPEHLKPMLAAEDGFVASFALDMAAKDLAADGDNDPIADLMADSFTAGAREEYERARLALGYKVFKDRKFVVSKKLVGAMQAFCKASGTRNIIYGA